MIRFTGIDHGWFLDSSYTFPLGQRFAMMEVKVVLSSTLRHFNIESIHRREEMFPSEEMVLRPTKGAWVKLTHRAV